MSEDPIRQYSEATKEFNAAYFKTQDFGRKILDVGSCLCNRPYQLGITSSRITFPPSITQGQKRTWIDESNWLSADLIIEALIDLYDKREKVKLAWDNLSSTDKQLVSPPDTKDK